MGVGVLIDGFGVRFWGRANCIPMRTITQLEGPSGSVLLIGMNERLAKNRISRFSIFCKKFFYTRLYQTLGNGITFLFAKVSC